MKTVWFSVLLSLFAIDDVGAQCCIGTGSALPSNAASCVNSTSVQVIPEEWTLLPASGATSCASQGPGYSCLTFKCSVSAMGASITIYGQECTTLAILTSQIQEAQTTLAQSFGNAGTVSCSSFSISVSSTKHPILIVFLVLVAGNALLLTII